MAVGDEQDLLGVKPEVAPTILKRFVLFLRRAPRHVVIPLYAFLTLFFWWYYCTVWSFDAPGSTQHDAYMIGVLLYNSEHLFPKFHNELLKTIHVLCKQYEGREIAVSIVEGPSRDATWERVVDLGEALSDWKCVRDVSIVRNEVGLHDPTDHGRMVYLASLRNRALEPLVAYAEQHLTAQQVKNSKIAFFNDVIFSSRDALRVFGLRNGAYDTACAIDFHGALYDTWVLRDRGGLMMDGYYPYTNNVVAQEAFRANQPVPVMTCWNGIIVMPLRPFVGHDALKFRTVDRENGECRIASESMLIVADLVARGYTRNYLNPQAIVSYKPRYFWLQQLIMPMVNPIIGLVRAPCSEGQDAPPCAASEPQLKDRRQLPAAELPDEWTLPLKERKVTPFHIQC